MGHQAPEKALLERKKAMQYRHGDVMLEQVGALPEHVQPQKGTTLAHGEVTGHAHRFAEPASVQLYRALDGLLYVKVLEPADLTHEEHKTLTIPPGIYRVWQQREYTPEQIRRVVD